VFDEHEKKKNIKARISLSDGLSRIIVMVPDKVWLQIVSWAFFNLVQIRLKMGILSSNMLFGAFK
jgi:hypothetical protein